MVADQHRLPDAEPGAGCRPPRWSAPPPGSPPTPPCARRAPPWQGGQPLVQVHPAQEHQYPQRPRARRERTVGHVPGHTSWLGKPAKFGRAGPRSSRGADRVGGRRPSPSRGPPLHRAWPARCGEAGGAGRRRGEGIIGHDHCIMPRMSAGHEPGVAYGIPLPVRTQENGRAAIRYTVTGGRARASGGRPEPEAAPPAEQAAAASRAASRGSVWDDPRIPWAGRPRRVDILLLGRHRAQRHLLLGAAAVPRLAARHPPGAVRGTEREHRGDHRRRSVRPGRARLADRGRCWPPFPD